MSLNKTGIYIERNTKSEYRKYTIYKVTLYLKTIANLQTANLTTEIRKCRLIAKQILLETPSASYFALHLRTYLHHYE